MNLLPNGDKAIVADAKIRDYLLNHANIQNGGKAALFEQSGFTRDAWERLAAAVRQHVMDNAVVRTIPSTYGTKHIVRCRMRTPDGRNPCRTTVWMVDIGAAIPRFVSAY